jgi:hypothetical protein
MGKPHWITKIIKAIQIIFGSFPQKLELKAIALHDLQ